MHSAGRHAQRTPLLPLLPAIAAARAPAIVGAQHLCWTRQQRHIGPVLPPLQPRRCRRQAMDVKVGGLQRAAWHQLSRGTAGVHVGRPAYPGFPGCFVTLVGRPVLLLPPLHAHAHADADARCPRCWQTLSPLHGMAVRTLTTFGCSWLSACTPCPRSFPAAAAPPRGCSQ